jgi:Tol biopolymer transport system component
VTRRPVSRSSRGPRRTTGDPYGLAAARPFLAPLLSAAGLAVVGLLTLSLLTGSIPFLPTRGGDTGANGDGPAGPVIGPGRTPSPSAAPIVNPEVGIEGRLVYAKAGNLWLQEGTETRRLTSTGRDSQPAWAPAGDWVYFIETRRRKARFPIDGVPRVYDLSYPILTRIRPDGTGREAILSGLYRNGTNRWFFFIRDPAVAPDGKTVAVVSDGPDPTKSNVVLQRINVASGKMSKVGVAEQPPYGHQDPAWRPDGRYLLYVRNARESGRGAPTIWRYEPETKKASRLSRPGYTEPLYSPNGRYIVATRTSSLGTDVVILDGSGNERVRVTNDGRSWGGAWSPDGNQIAFLRLVGSNVELAVATIGRGAGATLTVEEIEPLTEDSGLDASSRPAWWGPRPTPEPTPAAPATPAATSTPAP